MKRYTVVERDFLRPLPVDEYLLDLAKELQEQFGLYCYSLDTIVKHWSFYSDGYCATWLIPSKESVEEVFSVKLEEEQ